MSEYKIGDIIKRKGRVSLVYSACSNCGKARLVEMINGRPRHGLCYSCSRPGFGAQNPRWKGGITKSDEGYILVYKPEHPRSTVNGRVRRSHLVLEGQLGRYLKEGYLVHHINGLKDDDRPENLIEVSASEHTYLHLGENGQLSKASLI